MIIYTLKKTKLFNILNIFGGNKNIERFRENTSQDENEDEIGISGDLTKNIPCIEESQYDEYDEYKGNDHVNKDIKYISMIVDETSKEYILLTNPELYLNNLKYIANYNPNIEFIPQNRGYESIIEQLYFNVYSYNKKKYTDLISIVPEYYAEYYLEKSAITEEEEEQKEKDFMNKDYIRYIGGVSYTYYFFMVPIDMVPPVLSLNDIPLNINILYDSYIIGISKKNIEKNQTEIEEGLINKYKTDNQLNFIKEYIMLITNKNVNFTPVYLDDIIIKKEEGELGKLGVILGNNNMSHHMLGFLGINGSVENIYNIIGFDENPDTVHIDDDNVQDINNHYGNNNNKSKYTDENSLQEDYINMKTYIDIKTRELLNKNKLHNTLIQQINAFKIHEIPIKCKYLNNVDNEKRRKTLYKAGYNIHCIQDKIDTHLPSKEMFLPIKTFLFRNIAITHKFTTNGLVYNLLHLFMKNKNIYNADHILNNKFNLMSLNTNIELHKGAEKFYREYGFIKIG